jgi:siroheme decarboxylase
VTETTDRSASLRNDLIRAVQAGVPFDPRPFARLGEAIGASEAEVLAGLRSLTDEKILREISAVLEGSLLGYDSALVAGSVPEDRLERVAEVVNAHPTVTHNYLRNHAYNLWFTIAVPPEMGLEASLALLAREAGVSGFLPLRRTHTFKIGVNFDPETLQNRTQAVELAVAAPPLRVSGREARLLRALQAPLPLTERPFAPLARAAEVEEDELLAFARHHQGGAIRRYIGTLRHRNLGVRENGMVAWRVPEAGIEKAGNLLAHAPEVSHCYARNPIEGFPYTLYSMIHGPDQDRCLAIAAELARQSGLEDYAVLFSLREFKKVRLRYFLPELDAWWAARVGRPEA